MTIQEAIREETERHIRACLKVAGIEKDISDSLSVSLMMVLDGLGVVIRVDNPGWTLIDISFEPLIKGE